jgi:hypothetical protein
MRLRKRSNGAFGVAGFAHIARLTRVGALFALSILALGALTIGAAPVAHADSFALDILVPKAQNNTAEGPVGTNVTFSAQGAEPGHDYQLSYAPNKLGCAVGGPLGSAKADADGKFITTIAWPNEAGAVGTTFVICYKDKSLVGLAQATDQSFKVDAASPPSISLSQAPSSTPNPGTPSDSYYAGGPVQVSGKNYFSNGTQLLAFVTLNQDFAPGDLQAGSALKRPDGSTGFTPDANGKFNVMVTLPNITGNFYLQVVSNDGQRKYLPALIAAQPIKIGQAPAPTATVGPTVTPTVVGSTPTPPGGSGNGGSGNPVGVLGVLSLGGLSILLFILGVYLLTSTGATPRNL